MDLYVLDEVLRRTAVIDQYESLIWTERYAEAGDFELVIRADRGVRALLPTGTRVVINVSYRIMEVKTVENKINDDGIAVLVIAGKELVYILEDRVAWSLLTSLEARPTWDLSGTPMQVAYQIFQDVCVFGIMGTVNRIPFLTYGTLLPPGSITPPQDLIAVSLELDTVYSSIKKICDIYNLGFRLVRNGDTSQLYFEVYTGHDRTTLQTVNPPVVFSSELDNLTNTNQYVSTVDYKNTAYIFAPKGAAVVRTDGATETTSGFNLHVLMVKADDITLEPGPELNAALQQRGLEKLAEHRSLIMFDGEIPKSGSFIYDIDYGLGDLVEQRNAEGLATNMRVTEQIFISDAEGVRSYPTLSIELVITPGTWLSWDGTRVWSDELGYWIEA